MLEEIADDRGWTRSQLLSELRDRRRVLAYLQEQDITDYRRFTSMVNYYYADKDGLMDEIAESDVETDVQE